MFYTIVEFIITPARGRKAARYLGNDFLAWKFYSDAFANKEIWRRTFVTDSIWVVAAVYAKWSFSTIIPQKSDCIQWDIEYGLKNYCLLIPGTYDISAISPKEFRWNNIEL